MTPYFEREGIAIFNDDCRNVLPTLEQVDLVLTDPPYGIRLQNHGRRDGRRRDVDWTIPGDDDAAVGQGVVDYCRARWPIAAFASPRHPWAGEWRSYLVWHKPGVGVGGDPELCWIADWELIQIANNRTLVGPKESSVLRWPWTSADFADHPCAKPVGLCMKLIQKLSGETILDPFMGSGTTLVAAYRLGRKAIGIEVEERWCEVAAKRLEAQTPPLFVVPAEEPEQSRMFTGLPLRLSNVQP